jgi:DNA repair exonuclease SbcCD ATPase subunit
VNLDAQEVHVLRQMEEDSKVSEIIELKKQLQEERSKIESIDNILLQARKLTSIGRKAGNIMVYYEDMVMIIIAVGAQDAALENELIESKAAYKAAMEQLEEQKAKVEQDKQTIEKLQKRVKDLIQSHSSTLAELEKVKDLCILSIMIVLMPSS